MDVMRQLDLTAREFELLEYPASASVHLMSRERGSVKEMVHMPFVVVAIETSVAWTTTDVTVKYEGRTLTLRPGSKTLYPTVVLEYEPDTQEAQVAAVALIRRFLSALAWAEGFPIRIEMTGGGGFPVGFGRAEPGRVTVWGSWRA